MLHRPREDEMQNFQTWRATAVVVVGALTLLMSGVLPAGSARQPTVSDSAGVLALDWGDLDATPEAWRGNYVVMQPWEYARIPALKEKNPHVTVLMYKDASAAVKVPHESGVYSTGVSYQEAAQAGWLLHDQDGQIVEWSDWAGLFPTDVADPAYQDRWADNVLAELRRGDWDGVMMDDTLTYLSHDTADGRVPVEMPTDAAMYDATGSFLRGVASRIKRDGFLAIPNLTVEWNTWKDVLTDWTPYVSGWLNEYAVKWGLDSAGPRFVGADWRWKMELAAWCADHDVPLLAVTYSNRGDSGAEKYSRATWLLTWNGRTGSSIFVPAEPFTDHWVPRAMLDVGLPVAPRQQLPDGTWRRQYTRGLVLVNPTTSRHKARLARVYEKPNGRRVSELILPPLSGAVLRR
jgi:hypothetical protein